MLNNVQRLFSHHMIQTFGCDYSTSGVSLEALQTKLRNFLELRTEDGPRHDTYLVFYSGHTHKGTGAWALAGERCTYFSFSLLTAKSPDIHLISVYVSVKISMTMNSPTFILFMRLPYLHMLTILRRARKAILVT